MTRVAYLCTDTGIAWGGAKGASVHVAEIVGALAREGASVLLLVGGVADDAGAPPPNVAIERLPFLRKYEPAGERLAAAAELSAWLEQRLAEFGAEALYERLALYSAAGAAAARARDIPYFVELNAPLLEEAARYRELERADEAARLERETLAAADLVLPVTSPLAAYALERGAHRVEVTPNAVALERFERLARLETDGRPVAVFTGALRPWHGIETIAEAWRLLGAEAPPLRIVGDGPGRPLMEGLGAEVLGSVPHDRVPALLMSAEIGLAPYAADAPDYFSPLKLFEYLAAGLAVVAADLPGIADVVGSEGADLIPPGDANALAAAVARLTRDRERRRRLGRLGRSLVEEHTWERRARRILGAVAELRDRRVAAR